MRRVIILAVLAAMLAPMRVRATEEPVSIPVAFNVVNKNDSRALCPTDGANYTVRGHLTAPRAALEGDARSVTLYLHGGYTGEALWHLQGVPGFDHAYEMARLGHVSVTIDLLGYGTSGIPDGRLTCFGSDADVAHRVIARLRSGDYSIEGMQPVAFARVALAGLSAGGWRTIAEAGTFGDVDAVVVMDAADPDRGNAVSAAETVGRTSFPTDCATGLKRKGPSGGYYDPDARANSENLIHDGDPAAMEAFIGAVEPDPCGLIMWIPAFFARIRELQSSIRVPVLLMFGEESALWVRHAAEQEAGEYTSSPDVTAKEIPNAGHVLMFEKTAPIFRAELSSWLSARGF